MSNKTQIINNILINNKQYILAFIFLAIIGDILFLGQSEDVRLFSLLGLYVFCVWFYKLKSKMTFLFALCLLSLLFILLLVTSISANTEKTATWIVFLLAIGIIQQLKEHK